MERKRVLLLLFCGTLLITASLVGGRVQSRPASSASRREVSATAEAAAQAEKAPEAVIREAVDTYFTLQYESMAVDTALDLGVVVDKTTEEGRALLNYEQGRLEYFLFCWRNHAYTTTHYDYHPIYESIHVNGDTAVVHVRPWVDLWHPSPPDRPDTTYGDLHVITLVHRPAGWRIIADDYDNEWKQIWPVGTDFAALQAAYHKHVGEAKAHEAELQRQYGGENREQPEETN